MMRMTLLLISFFSFNANSIEISGLFHTIEDKLETQFSVKNTEEKRIFLRTSVTELVINDGEIEEIPYNKDNIDDWKFGIYPARSIVEPKFQKDLKAKLLCKPIVNTNCSLDKDMYFKVAVVPVPYVAPGSEQVNLVQFAVGFAPLIVVPAQQQRVSLLYDYNDDASNLSLKNNGNTYLSISVADQSCIESDCEKSFKLLAGRKVDIDLSPLSIDNAVVLKVETNKEQFKNQYIIPRGRKGKI